ncbi:MAG TPA: M1 family metallopeptidase [Longimicrobiales bacterium]|jgi:hypothetical protein
MPRLPAAFILLGTLAAVPATGLAQTMADRPERAIRRDVPMTNMIRRAHAAGTRDSTGAPGPAYWQLDVSYTIDARLDVATGMLTGRETIEIDNNGPDPLGAVVLRLHQNVYSPTAQRARAVPDLTDGMEVTAIAVNGVPVDLDYQPPGGGRGGRGAAPQSPEQNFATGLGSTPAAVALKDPIPAGGSGTLDVEWRFRVPAVEGGRGLRMGAWGDSLFQVAQWYPQVAVYDDLRGWDTEPYLGSSEFYNNFGRFEVSIDVPAGYTVGATGLLRNPEEVLSPMVRERLSGVLDSDETLTIVGEDEAGSATAAGDRLVWRFVADYVNDFAWATSNRYVWQATRVAIPGGETIPFHWMYLPGNAARFEGADDVGRHALQFYSELWMPYDFPILTMVDGPDTGMEYPMFIMSARGAEDHEIGHEWWPMMVGTNETWYGFMDEGFNQYMNILSGAARSGEAPNLDGRGQSYGRVSGDEREAPLMWNANYGGPMYSFQAYSKAPLMLSMLGGIVGDEEVWRAMSEYARAWKFKHPSPWDYMFFMNRALGEDLDWFWYYWLFTTESVDGSIANVATSGPTTTVTVRQDGQMPSPVVLGVRFSETGPAIRPMPNAEMVDDRIAVVTWPVDVWFSGSRTFQAELDFGGRAIEAIMLDPRGRFPDRDPSDNTWPREMGGGSTGGPGD